jgi:hypothetical protein
VDGNTRQLPDKCSDKRPHLKGVYRGIGGQLIDQRTREGRLLQATRQQLLAQIGGQASPTQQAHIDRAAWLTVHIAAADAQMAAKAAAGEPVEQDAHLAYMRMVNALSRLMRLLSPPRDSGRGRRRGYLPLPGDGTGTGTNPALEIMQRRAAEREQAA